MHALYFAGSSVARPFAQPAASHALSAPHSGCRGIVALPGSDSGFVRFNNRLPVDDSTQKPRLVRRDQQNPDDCGEVVKNVRSIVNTSDCFLSIYNDLNDLPEVLQKHT